MKPSLQMTLFFDAELATKVEIELVAVIGFAELPPRLSVEHLLDVAAIRRRRCYGDHRDLLPVEKALRFLTNGWVEQRQLVHDRHAPRTRHRRVDRSEQ